MGFQSHTYSGVAVDYRVNGTPFNETMILAMGRSSKSWRGPA